MTVDNRKLFANRDARRRLSEMGGIMASSPELLGEAQKFQDGGRVIPGSRQEYIINVPGITRPGEFLRVSEDTLMMLNNAVPGLMSQRDTLVETADSIGNMVDSRPGDALIGTRLQNLAPTTGDGREPVGPTIGDQIGSSLRSFFQPIGQSMRETMQPAGQAIREGLASSYELGPVEALMSMRQEPTAPPAMEEVPVGGRNLDADMGIGYDPMMTPTVARVVSDQAAGINRNQRVPAAPAAAPAPSTRMTAEEAYAASNDFAGLDGMPQIPGTPSPTGPGTTAPVPEKDVTGDIISAKMDADAAANQTDLMAMLEATATDPELPTEEKVKKTTTDVLGGVGGIKDADKMTTQDRVKAYEAMFKEMLGEGDEDTQKEMWHNMAMIGFAIAAGESPRALQNIANGLLAGTKMMKEDRSAKKEREDKIKMLAITEGMREERAAQDRLTDLQVAAIRSAGSDSERKRVNNPTNPITEIGSWEGDFIKTNMRSPTPEERSAQEDIILKRYSLPQIQEGAPQYETRWRRLNGYEKGEIKDGFKYNGPSFNPTEAAKQENWVKVE